MGTPGYVAPEQVLGQPSDSRSDIYSWGTNVYEMLSGRRPYRTQGVDGLQENLRSEPDPLPKEIPQDLQELVSRCLARHPNDRPSAEELIAELIA